MLPMSTPYSRKVDNGIKNQNVVNNQVVFTLIWLCVSVVAVIWGCFNCYNNAYSYKMSCNKEMCTFTYPAAKDWLPSSGNAPFVLKRSDMKFIETTNVKDDGEVVNTDGMRNVDQGKLGMSVSIKYNQMDASGDESIQTLIFPPMNIGRRKARGVSRKIKDYVQERLDKVSSQHGQSVTAVGILCVIFGSVSVLLSFVLGTWKDEKIKKMRRNWVKGSKRSD